MIKGNFLIVDDEALIREGLRVLLEKEPFVRDVYEASDLAEFTAQLRHNPDVILLDFRLSATNALELLAVLGKQHPARIIVITGLEGTELIINLLRWGVHGIVYKLDGYKEIRKAIEKVMDGDTYFPEKVLNIIRDNAYQWEQTPSVSVTHSERQLLAALAEGLTTKEIALKLKMNESTTETYRTRLMRKTNTANTAGLLAFAYRNGIL